MDDQHNLNDLGPITVHSQNGVCSVDVVEDYDNLMRRLYPSESSRRKVSRGYAKHLRRKKAGHS